MTATANDLFETRDVTAAASRAGAGLALVAVGWYQASHRLLLTEQAPWLALAAIGTLVAAASGVLWILGLRRAVAIRLARVRAAIAAIPLPSAGGDRDGDTIVVLSGTGLRLFHRADCALVAGRPVVAATDHDTLDRLPCGACVDV